MLKGLYDKVTKRQEVEIEGSVTLASNDGVDIGDVGSDEIIPTGFASIADVSVDNTTATIVLAASTTRQTAFITNPQVSGGVIIRVGDSSTGASRGTVVPPQATLAIQTTAAIYVYRTRRCN